MILGNAKIPFRQGLETFLDALSTIANVGLFVLLGLLVFPREFATIWPQGVALFAILTLVARPARCGSPPSSAGSGGRTGSF